MYNILHLAKYCPHLEKTQLFISVSGMEISRSYTPVCRLKSTNQPSTTSLEFIIKIYSDGALTQHINSLNLGKFYWKTILAWLSQNIKVLMDLATAHAPSILLKRKGIGEECPPNICSANVFLFCGYPTHVIRFTRMQFDIMCFDCVRSTLVALSLSAQVPNQICLSDQLSAQCHNSIRFGS